MARNLYLGNMAGLMARNLYLGNMAGLMARNLHLSYVSVPMAEDTKLGTILHYSPHPAELLSMNKTVWDTPD